MSRADFLSFLFIGKTKREEHWVWQRTNNVKKNDYLYILATLVDLLGDREGERREIK